MRSKKFHCPGCRELLTIEFRPANVDKPYCIMWCSTGPRCPSPAANDGGSGPTEEEAYRSLLAAVDQETEKECEPLVKYSPDELKERILTQKAEHENDLKRSEP